jgi:hypothetical protein
MDSWSDYFDFQRWLDAFAAAGLEPDFYARRGRTKDEVLPCSMVDVGVRPEYLWREREQAYKSVITPDCRVKCTGCGTNCLIPGGVCDEDRR